MNLPLGRGPNQRDSIQEPVVPLERYRHGHIFVSTENQNFLSPILCSILDLCGAFCDKKLIDLEEPTPWLFQVYFGLHPERSRRGAPCCSSENISFRRITTEVTSEEQNKSTFSSQHITEWSYDSEGHNERCAQRYCELAGKSVSALKLAETPCMDDHQFSTENLNGTGELAPICAQIVQYACSWPDRSVTRWNTACENILAWLIIYINQT